MTRINNDIELILSNLKEVLSSLTQKDFYSYTFLSISLEINAVNILSIVEFLRSKNNFFFI